MVKVFTLLFSAIFAVASVGGYGLLNAKILAGERQISAGQKEVDKGQPALDIGKSKLEAGKIELAEGKAEYENAHANLFLVFLDQLFNGGKGFEDGRKKIAEGDKWVAQGEARIIAGEKKLAAGELELYRGIMQLKIAKGVRNACALIAVFFGGLSIGLAILWRRSLALVFAHPAKKIP